MADVVERLKALPTSKGSWVDEVCQEALIEIEALRARLSQAGAGGVVDISQTFVTAVAGNGKPYVKIQFETLAEMQACHRALVTTPPATPVQPTASVEAEDLHDFITHRRAWRQALEMALAASDSMETAEYWNHEVKAFDRAFDLIAPIASLTPAPTQGDGDYRDFDDGYQWARDIMRDAPTPSAPVSAPSPAGVREATVRVLNDNGKRWRVESADGRWEIKPTGQIDADEARRLCERVATALSSPNWQPVAEMEKSGTIFAKSWCPAVGRYPGRWFSARHYEWSAYHGEWREIDHGCSCIRDDDAYRWVAVRLPPDPAPPALEVAR